MSICVICGEIFRVRQKVDRSRVDGAKIGRIEHRASGVSLPVNVVDFRAVPKLEASLPPALLIQTTPGRETVAAGVWITRGAAHDPPTIAGATHLVEHLTLRACGGHDRRTLARLVDRLGGEVDAWTSSELMGISINTTVDAVGDALDLLVDAVLSPTFDPDDVELERRVTRAELELVADDPAERVERRCCKRRGASTLWRGRSLELWRPSKH